MVSATRSSHSATTEPLIVPHTEFFRNYEKDLQTMQRLRDQREEEAPGCTANDPAFEMWLGNLPPKNKQPNK